LRERRHPPPAEAAHGERLAAAGQRLVERAGNAVDAITHATGVYFPRRAHGARIAIKQVRYAAEIADATGVSGMESALRVLRKGQENLGDLHDRQTLADALEGYGKEDGVDPDHVQAARHVLESEVVQLHGQYLARRASLRDACGEVEHAVSRVWRPGPAIAVGTALAVSGILYGRQPSPPMPGNRRERHSTL
jgi:hypothetical protein